MHENNFIFEPSPDDSRYMVKSTVYVYGGEWMTTVKTLTLKSFKALSRSATDSIW